MKQVPSRPPSVRLLTRPCETRAETSRWLCRNLNLPYERGPSEVKSLTETNEPGFLKFNPQAHPPAHSAPLAPLRDLVPLTEPCSGLLSAGARADLRLPGKTRFIDRVYTPSDLRTPSGARDRPQTPTGRPSAVTEDLSEDKRWNSRTRSELAKLQDQAANEETEPDFPKTPWSAKPPEKDVRSSVLSDFVNTAARRYSYTSAAQRGYEDVDWDSKLPPRFKAPLSTLEKMADPVNQHFTLKRYNSRPELWQAIGTYWNKHQLRATYNAKKPVSFTSPHPKSGQIPLYCGVVGSENMDNVDDPDKDFKPLTVLRTILPPYTPTAHRPTIPGYTGKALHARPHTSDITLPSRPIPGSSLPPSVYGRKAPLSRMVTTVSPCNPFLLPKTPALPS
ncbi:spermatogenesis-associated protein 48 isoform X1 [Astyanax mexicanus]|uniref:spermatogenesis-associated protein 48 isoform X1 n=1 Tax=Astyanax mexicanus TaxID=7994 RepID=UPI0020CAFFE0|nr:spermatogenesis-associated protein 48 isoform X1 [Astyanax mexicanus]